MYRRFGKTVRHGLVAVALAASPLAGWDTALTQAARAAGLTRLPSSCTPGTWAASRVSQAASKCVKASPWAWAASLRRANWACSSASRWARKAASPKRGASERSP